MEKQGVIYTFNMIDLVVPYVDSNDTNWQKLYSTYCPDMKVSEDSTGNTRFRGQDEFFRYFFRGIEKNLTWINNTFLVVQSESQVPKWLNRQAIKIITHDQFIPEKYLPTFNSCTIEMFLWAIPGLSEKFIYFNDDFFAINKIQPEQFFDNENILLNLFKTTGDTIYANHCKNANQLIYNTESSEFYTVAHTARPYIKSEMINCYDKYEEQILSSISAFRTQNNFNCYMYSLYLDLIGKRKDSHITTAYIASDTFGKMSELHINKLFKKQIMCINDNLADKNIYKDRLLLSYFYRMFDKKSKFELYEIPNQYKKTYFSQNYLYL